MIRYGMPTQLPGGSISVVTPLCLYFTTPSFFVASHLTKDYLFITIFNIYTFVPSQKTCCHSDGSIVKCEEQFCDYG